MELSYQNDAAAQGPNAQMLDRQAISIPDLNGPLARYVKLWVAENVSPATEG